MSDTSTALAAALNAASSTVRLTLNQALAGREMQWQTALELCRVEGADLAALVAAADALRRTQVGEHVSYVVNRNINFTNVCVKACKFCAFSRTHRSEQGYFLNQEEVVRRAVEAHALGATEVCLQAGLPPDMDGRLYIELCRAVKEAAPGLHVHAFSPEEIKYGASRLGCSIRDYVRELKDAGLGSIPGTSAEILDDELRRQLAGGRISSAEWIEVICTAHELGIPTTATVMFGHLETDAQLMRHLDTLRSIQRDTVGFTEFVPLSFIPSEAPLYSKSLVRGVRPGPTRTEVVRLFAIARLFLGASFRNIQASWVKEGLEQAQRLLSCGANDLGGTLINESISTSAGARHGQRLRPADLRRLIREAGRVPQQRDTLYGCRRTYTATECADEHDALDYVADAEERFGSYAALTRDARHRFNVQQHRN